MTIAVALIPASSAYANERHVYNISVDYALSRLFIEARFAHPVTSITARSRDAGKYLVDVRGCDQQRNIRMRNRRMMLPQGGIDCIYYTVDLSKAARHDRNYRDLAVGNAIIAPSLWLWRPEVNVRSEIDVNFTLPRDVRVSVPWRKREDSKDSYRIRRSPESSYAPVVFGNFDFREIAIEGSILRVSLLRGADNVDKQAMFDWVEETAKHVNLAYGRFPNPAPQVVVVPINAGRGSGPVPFGQVIRDGGETVQLFVNPDRSMNDFKADWTATHEFSHLMLPYLERRYRWISEGFSQYYQNVLLVRAGIYDEQYAWQKLYDGYERGRKSRPELSPNEAAEGRVRSGTMKIYWSGAALALMADVELREQSGGKESLDSILGKLQQCCLPGDRVWSGEALFQKLDTLATRPVFIPLLRRYADTAGFPDTRDVFVRLGIATGGGKIKFRRNGELSEIRLAITRGDPNHVDQQLAGTIGKR